MKQMYSINRSGRFSPPTPGTPQQPEAWEYPGFTIMWVYQAFLDTFPVKEQLEQGFPFSVWAILVTPLPTTKTRPIYRMDYLGRVTGVSTPFKLQSGRMGCTVMMDQFRSLAQGTEGESANDVQMVNLAYVDLLAMSNAILRPAYDVILEDLSGPLGTPIKAAWDAAIDVADLSTPAVGTIKWRKDEPDVKDILQTTWVTRSKTCSIQTGKWTEELDWWAYDFDDVGDGSYPWQMITYLWLPIGIDPTSSKLLWPAFSFGEITKPYGWSYFVGSIIAGSDDEFMQVASQKCALSINYMDNP